MLPQAKFQRSRYELSLRFSLHSKSGFLLSKPFFDPGATCSTSLLLLACLAFITPTVSSGSDMSPEDILTVRFLTQRIDVLALLLFAIMAFPDFTFNCNYDCDYVLFVPLFPTGNPFKSF